MMFLPLFYPTSFLHFLQFWFPPVLPSPPLLHFLSSTTLSSLWFLTHRYLYSTRYPLTTEVHIGLHGSLRERQAGYCTGKEATLIFLKPRNRPRFNFFCSAAVPDPLSFSTAATSRLHALISFFSRTIWSTFFLLRQYLIHLKIARFYFFLLPQYLIVLLSSLSVSDLLSFFCRRTWSTSRLHECYSSLLFLSSPAVSDPPQDCSIPAEQGRNVLQVFVGWHAYFLSFFPVITFFRCAFSVFSSCVGWRYPAQRHPRCNWAVQRWGFSLYFASCACSWINSK